MNCTDCTAHLHALIDGELSAADTARVESHLATCAACERALASLRSLRTATAALPREIAPARDLWPAVAAQLDSATINFGSAAASTLSPPTPPAPKGKLLHWLAPLAVAATIALLATIAERSLPRPGWDVSALAGQPRIDAAPLAAATQLRRGQWLETDAQSRAEVSVGTIGRVSVDPNSRIRILDTSSTDHRLELARGRLSALIWAPPRLFFVETPSATAVDLGCAYILDVDAAGNGELRVTSGYVALEDRGRESIIPRGYLCLTRRGLGPGTPFADDAPAPFRAALERFDFGPAADRPAALATLLTTALPGDAVTLWHLLTRAPPTARPAVYAALALHRPPPVGVTREGILSSDTVMLRSWAADLGLGSFAR